MLARAETLDGEIVEGYYRVDTSDCHEMIIAEENEIEIGVYQRYVDPSTLEYKIGDEWYSMEQLEIILKNANLFCDPSKTTVHLDREQYGAYMDWSMQNGYR